MKFLDKNFFNELMVEVVMRFKKHIFDDKGGGANANDVHGRPYKGYSEEYGKAKKSGKLKGIDGTPQDTKFSNSTAPVLTGQFKNSFDESAATSKGFGFGTISGRGRLKSLTNMKREVSTNAKPLPDEVADYIMDEVNKKSWKWWRKVKDNEITI